MEDHMKIGNLVTINVTKSDKRGLITKLQKWQGKLTHAEVWWYRGEWDGQFKYHLLRDLKVIYAAG